MAQAKRFAKAMHASLIFCSTSASINVQKIFKIVLAKACGYLLCTPVPVLRRDTTGIRLEVCDTGDRGRRGACVVVFRRMTRKLGNVKVWVGFGWQGWCVGAAGAFAAFLFNESRDLIWHGNTVALKACGDFRPYVIAAVLLPSPCSAISIPIFARLSPIFTSPCAILNMMHARSFTHKPSPHHSVLHTYNPLTLPQFRASFYSIYPLVFLPPPWHLNHPLLSILNTARSFLARHAFHRAVSI